MLNIDEELKAVDEIETKLTRLNACKVRVGNEGMSRELGYELQDLCGGPITGIDPRKLTANPSFTGSAVANEAIDIKRAALMMMGSMAVLALLIKLLQWIFGSSGGGGRGGGGGSGSSHLNKIEDEVKELVREAEKRREKLIEDPDAEAKHIYFGRSLAEKFIEDILIQRKGLSLEQRQVLMSRVSAWFQLYKIMGVEQEQNNPAFVLMVHLAKNPDKCIDFRMAAFAKEFIVSSKESMSKIETITSEYNANKKYKGFVLLKQYISQDLLDEAFEVMELIRNSVDNMTEITDIYDVMVKYPNDRNAPEELEAYKAAFIKELFGDRSPYKRRGQDKDVHIITVDTSRNASAFHETTTHIPDGPAVKSTYVDVWDIQMADMADATLRLDTPPDARSGVDTYAIKLVKYGHMYNWFFANSDVLLGILENSNIRQLSSFKDKLNALAKKTEKEAKELQERIIKYQKAGAHLDYLTNRNMLDTIGLFLNGTLTATKALAKYCKHIEQAQKAVAMFKN